MILLKQTEDSDLAIENNDFVLITGLDALEQLCKSTLLMRFGEWFLNTQLGVPWYQTILAQKNPDLGVITSVLSDALLGLEEVLSITQLQVDFDTTTRKMTVFFGVQGDAGTITSEINI